MDSAVERSARGEALVAVAFSGGLDSSIVARCASRHVKVVACSAFAPGSADSGKVSLAAEEMGLELKATELTMDKVEETLRTIDLPFAPTLMDRGLWCLYASVSRSAQESGARVLLLGQLADELFGGYAKYAEALEEKGDEAARSMMETDFREYASRGRLRDFGACRGRVEPRLPFEAPDVVDLAAAIPVSFKIRGAVRKAVLRRAAVNLGVPEGVADAAKKAAQYSSGVQKLLAGSHF